MTYEEAIEYATAVVGQWKDWVSENSEQYQFYKLSLEILEKVRDGKMIELPCKVGDTAYRIEYDNEYTDKPNYDNGIVDFVVKEIAISDVGVEFKDNYEDMYIENEFFEELGEDWFLTREEAEKALKKLKEREQK